MLNCRIIKLNGYKIISKKFQYYKKMFLIFSFKQKWSGGYKIIFNVVYAQV